MATACSDEPGIVDGPYHGDAFPDRLYDAFMTAYAQTRGFAVPGIDYDAEFEPADVCVSE